MGLSQRDLATMLQISDKAVSSYEVDRATPPLGTLRKISEITHKSVEYFVNEDENQELDLQLQIKKIEHDLLEAKQTLLQLQASQKLKN